MLLVAMWLFKSKQSLSATDIEVRALQQVHNASRQSRPGQKEDEKTYQQAIW